MKDYQIQKLEFYTRFLNKELSEYYVKGISIDISYLSGGEVRVNYLVNKKEVIDKMESNFKKDFVCSDESSITLDL